MSAPRSPFPVPPGADPCALLAEAVGLRVDRELDPATSAALEAHLAGCPTCRARAREAQAVSSVLRRWDAERAGGVRAPARLRCGVRSAVAESGRRRRSEVRRLFWGRVLIAALVVLSLGTGAVLGLRAGEERESSGSDALVAQAPAAPTPSAAPPAPLEFPGQGPAPRLGIATLVRGPSRLHDLRFPPSPAERGLLLAESERRFAIDVLAAAAARRLERESFERETGDQGWWWTDPVGGGARLVTLGALRHLRERGADSVETFLRQLGQVRTVPGRDATGKVVPTGRTAADLLGLPAGRARIEASLRDGPVDGTGARRFSVALLPAEAPRRTGPAVRDLATAVQEGDLVLAEGADDDLVALAHDLRTAVFVPAGELVAGGRVDRVVARPVWIPAAEGEQRLEIPCVAAATAGASRGGAPVPTGMVAGPSVRALLARGARPDAVRAWIGERVPLLEGWGRNYSLLAFHDPVRNGGNLEVFRGSFARSGAHGFLVTGADGTLRGFEATDLPAEAAASLLARLALGYAAEAAMESLAAKLGDTPPAWPNDPPAALDALAALAAATGSLVAPADAEGAARVSSSAPPEGPVSVSAVEDRPGGAAVLVSVFPR